MQNFRIYDKNMLIKSEKFELTKWNLKIIV